MEFKLSGVLYEKFDPIQRTATFKIREFVLEKIDEVNGRSIFNYIKFQCTQDKIELLDKINAGDKITVSFNVRGSKWEKNGQVSYFNNLDAWKIEKDAGSATDVPTTNDKSAPPPESPSGADDSDLPF